MNLDTVQSKRVARILVLLGNVVVLEAVHQLVRGASISVVFVVFFSGLAVALVGVMASMET
jgi:hypothetical protein